MKTREPSKSGTPGELDAAAAAVMEKKTDPEALAALMTRWEEEDAVEPEPTGSWDEFRRALDSNRHSTRKLFP